MTPLRRRALAVAIVGGATMLTAVMADVVITPNPASSASGTLGTPMRVVTSIRNATGAGFSVDVQKVTSMQCPSSVAVSPLTGNFPVALGPGEQFEIVVYSQGFTGADLLNGQPSCTFAIVQNPPGGVNPGLTVNFTVGTAGSPIDPQGQRLSFQPVANGTETQVVVISNYGVGIQSGITASINEPGGRLLFAPGSAGCSGQVCALPDIASGSALQVPVQCQAGSSSVSGSLQYAIAGGGSGSGIAMQMLGCTAGSATDPGRIQLGTMSLTIVTTPNMLGTASTNVTFTGTSDMLQKVHLTGPEASYFSLPDLTCTPEQTCDFAAPLGLPYTLTIGCTPDSLTTRNAQLSVFGVTDGSDQAIALVTCNPNGGSGPILQVSTDTVTVPTAIGVHSTSAGQPFTITNAGSGTLTAGIVVHPPSDQEWTVVGCTQAAPCSLVGHGSAATVSVFLRPIAHGDRTGAMEVQSNDPANMAENITLVGSGSGGFLQVIDPSALAFHFGTVPSTQTATYNVALLDSGNVGLVVNVNPPGAPFSTNAGTVNLAANNGANGFIAQCGPGSAFSGSGDYVLTSQAYNASSIALHADCTIVDAPIEVTPTRFDFDELRVGAPAVELPFSIKNVTGADVTIADLVIANAPDVLELDAAATPMVLHGGDRLDGKVRLRSTTETLLAGNVALEFTAGTADLSLPITGKVVIPHAKLDPVALDLGTACVGSPASGTVRLVNDGTATLTLQTPTMDGSFVTRFGSPTAFPAPLLPTDEASVDILPASSAMPGSIHGILTWPVDVSGGAFQVPVDLDYIAAGAAVSPQRYDFEAIPVATVSDRRVITLENCNDEPLGVTINGIVAEQGDADAWDVQPRYEQRTLLPHATMRLMTQFTPKRTGRYKAHIAISAGDMTADVELVGEALGPLDPTSFYACTCSGPGLPTGGWPIGAAVALLVAPRRRRRHAS